jgi:photosystem II stability/assembly factor-like uncharacterized protein
MKSNFSSLLWSTLLMIILFASVAIISSIPHKKTKGIRGESKEEMTPNDWMAMQRIYPYQRINPQALRNAYDQVKQFIDNGPRMDTPWTQTGPINIGGRITDVELPPDDMNTIYLGASTGGVFKSTDFGQNWTNLFTSVPYVSVGDIAIDPNNTSTIYVGTGEANSSSFSFLGNGMYKSTDASQTWQHIGLDNSAYIGRVIVDYSNSQRVFVAACGNLFSYNDERGIYRSTDGGTSWQRVLYLTDSTSGIDIVMHPGNPNILYAAMWERTRGLEYRNSFGNSSGIWKSMDGGDTWTEMTNGVPTGSNVGRIGLTIAKSNPDVLYAYYDLANMEVGVYKTVNGGQQWTRVNDGALQGMSSNFGWYFGQIRVNPEDENQVYVMGVYLYRSDNGGMSWNDLSWNDIHVDHHAMFFDEVNDKVIEGNDGGLYYSGSQGDMWTKFYNLPVTQFYAIDIDYQKPYRIYGGTQDNNTIRTLTGGINNWGAILGGDGMYTLVDYTNSDVIFAEYQYGNLYRSDDGGYNMNYIAGQMSGDRVGWSAPLAMDPFDPYTLYFGTYRIWKTTDQGWSWAAVSNDLTKGGSNYFHTLTTIAVSRLSSEIVVTGAGDGKVYVSENAGGTWTDRTAGLPDRWITHVATDPVEVNTIYATLSGFRWDEKLPHVFKSTDLGKNWTDISGNLPELPVNDIVLDPDVEGRIIVGTDAGMFGTYDSGQNWFWIWTDLPAVPVCAIKIHPGERKIVAGTYGLSTFSASLDDIFTGLPENSPPVNLKMTVSPNPVTSSSRVKFMLPESDLLSVRIINGNGQKLCTLFSGKMEKGEHQIIISETGSLTQGIYYIVLEGKKFNAFTKIIRM